MLIQLLLATIMSLVTVVIHLTGLAFLVRILRSHHRLVRPLKSAPVAVLLISTATIFAIHTAEIWLYAFLYVLLGALGTFEVALYFSTVTYSSVGYGDVLLGQELARTRCHRGCYRNPHDWLVNRVPRINAGAAQITNSRLADTRGRSKSDADDIVIALYWAVVRQSAQLTRT